MAVASLRGRPPKQPSLLDLLSQTILAQQSEAKQSAQANLAACASDPVRFVDEYVIFPEGKSLTPYQRDILGAIPVQKRIVVRSPHGTGKSATAALAILWFALTSEALETDWKVVTTAGAWRQLTKYLWPEVHLWARRLRWDKLGRSPFNRQTELLSLSLKLPYGEAFAVATDNPELIEGAHATRIFVIPDEAKAIPHTIFDAMEGALSGGSPEVAYAFALSTPGLPSGRFYELNTKRTQYADWWVRHVTAEEAMAAGRMNHKDYEDRKRQWGEHHPIFKNRMRGEFAEDISEGVIPYSWVEQAQRRWEEWDAAGRPVDSAAPIVVGVDVAAEGDDETAIAFARGPIVEWVRAYARADTMETTGRAAGLHIAYPSALLVVDAIGLGAGVVDRLREEKHSVEAFKASDGAPSTDKTGEIVFLNKRAWALWTLRERLDPQQDGGSQIALPPEERLLEDLCVAKWKLTSAGRLQVEPKEQIKKRLGRSPDTGEAVVLALVGGDTPVEVQFFA